jgi:hypothetical protein
MKKGWIMGLRKPDVPGHQRRAIKDNLEEMMER